MEADLALVIVAQLLLLQLFVFFGVVRSLIAECDLDQMIGTLIHTIEEIWVVVNCKETSLLAYSV